MLYGNNHIIHDFSPIAGVYLWLTGMSQMVDVMDRIKLTYPHPTHPIQCDGGRAPDGHGRSLSNVANQNAGVIARWQIF